MLRLKLLKYFALPTTLLLSFIPTYIAAKDFTITTRLDQVDVNPGDGSCLTLTNECSLRAAVMEANALAGDDRIYLSAEQYDLTIGGINENLSETGDLDITGNTSIIGQGKEETTITGSFEFRIFSILRTDDDTIPEVNISNMTLTQGTPAQYGAVIFNNSTLNLDNVIIENAGDNPSALTNTPALHNDKASLVISNSIFQGNSLALYSKESQVTIKNSVFNNNRNIVATTNEQSAAIYSNNDTLYISSTTFKENISLSPGAAIHAVNSDVRIEGSKFILNSASNPNQADGTYGGALFLSSPSETATNLTKISDTTFENNSVAGSGGAIFNSAGNLYINRSTFINNSAALTDKPSFGGALAIRGNTTSIKSAITIENSVISSNSSGYMGGGIFTYAQSNSSETILLSNSEISYNEAVFGGGLYLGGEQEAAIGNTTISNNSASNSGAGIFFGESTTSELALSNVTLAFNHSENAANLFVANGTLKTTSTIFSNPLAGENCSGVIVSQGYNLASDSSCSLIASENDIININPLLLPLSENSGTTRTHALSQESLAINNGNNTRCSEFISFDQRYFYRADEQCDIGAFEQNAALAKRGTLNFAAELSSARELDRFANITISRTEGSETAIFATLRDSLLGTAIPGRDYIFPNINLLWADGDTEDKTFKIRLIDNSRISLDKSIFIELFNASNGVYLAPGVHEIMILDDESRRGVAEFDGITFDATESSDEAFIKLIRKSGIEGELSIKVTTSDGTAISGQDYEGGSSTAVFPDGVIEILHPINIEEGQDEVYELNKTFYVSIEENDETKIGNITTAVVTIIDDDEQLKNPGEFSFEFGNYTIDEFRSTFNINIIRSNGVNGDMYLDLLITEGTAKLETDITAINGSRKLEQKLLFPAGRNTLPIKISINNDRIPEDNETLTLSLISQPIGGAILGNIRTTVVTIVDNDGERARLSFDKETYSVYKDTKFINIEIVRSRVTSGVSSVIVNLFNNTSIYNSNNRWKPQSLEFKEGETKYTLKLNVSDINSDFFGGSISLFLSHAKNGNLGEIRNTTITFGTENPSKKSASERDEKLSRGAASINPGYLVFISLLLVGRYTLSKS